MTIEIKSLTPHVGAEIIGLDLRKAADAATAEALRGVSRSSSLGRAPAGASDDDQVRFARIFGEISVRYSRTNEDKKSVVQYVSNSRPEEPIYYPRQSSEVHYEAEPAVVIGRICRDVPPERVADVIFGYTVGNDVTARDLQRSDKQCARAKGFDSFCPLGPWIETELDAVRPRR